MVDRQDIDALLISALYGELTPADEARLTAHLESHPGDKSALADLTRTRATVRESRFLTVQLEPPQAVSAMLLQEATRNRKVAVVAVEPPKESWFQRFVRSFAAHPAMAAAAMLVIVVGFAGAMWLRKGDTGFADQQAPAFDRGVAANAPAAEPLKEAEELRLTAGSGYAVQLDEGEAGSYRATDKKSAQIAGDDTLVAKGEKADSAKDALAAKPAPKITYLRPEAPKYDPKELAPSGDLEDAKPGRAGVGSTTGGARRTPDVVITDGKSPTVDPAATAIPPTTTPPRAPKAGQTVARGAGSAAGPATGADEGQLRDREKSDEDQWARDQHAKVAVAVKANNCKQAASLALALSNRAPGYYNTNVETDRALKQCMTYIVSEREKEAERVQRARALEKSRRNADEPRATKPAATDSKK
jgi:hypothetical protein